jgi:hypothetical protein
MNGTLSGRTQPMRMRPTDSGTRADPLAADRGANDEKIARRIGVGGSTVYRTKRRFWYSATCSTKSRARARAVSLPAKRKPRWSRRPVRARPWALASDLAALPVNWPGSLHTKASRGKPCAGAWPKTI